MPQFFNSLKIDKKTSTLKGKQNPPSKHTKHPTTEMFEWPQANKRTNGTLTLLLLPGPQCPAIVRHFINLAIS